MRTTVLVVIAYLLAVVLASVWRLVPLGVTSVAIPDIFALTAAYLGLTARQGVAPAVGGAVVLGYLGDLLCGAPTGLISLTAGVVCIVAYAANSRILVRGLATNVGFSAFVAAAAALFIVLLRLVNGLAVASPSVEVWRIIGPAIATGVCGPIVLRWYRRIDAAFARTQRERDHALEGLTP